MKRALLALLLCVSLPASAANLHSYPPDVSAVPWGGAGAPSSGSWAEGAMVVDTSGDVYVCTVAGTPGTWVSLGGGGVAGITAAGTVSDSWTTNTDYAAGDDEDPSLVLRGGDAAGETNSVFLTTLKQISDGAGTVINTLTTTDDGAATGTAFLIGAFGSVANVGSVLLISAGSGILNHTFEIEVTTAGVVNFKSAAGLNGFVFALGSTFSDTLTVTNLTTLNGSVELGGGATDSISWNGVLDTDIVPDAPNTRSLGAASTDYLAVYTRAVTAGTGASLALSSNGGAWNLGGGTGSVFSSTGVADSSVQLTLGKSTAFLADTDVDATLHFRGHQVGDALGLATTASIALDASGDALVISPPVNGTTFSGGDLLMDGGNIQLAALATVDGVDVSALDSSVSTHTGNTANPHSVTAAQTGALAASTCAEGPTVWGCTANDEPAILTPAQVRAAAGLDGLHTFVGFDSARLTGGAGVGTVAHPLCDGTDCYSRITLTSAASTLAGCRQIQVESWASSCDETTAVSLEYRVGATGTPEATLRIYDSITDTSPCYSSSAGTSTTWATLSVDRATLATAGCAPPAGSVAWVCLDCAGDTSETCDAREVLCDLE